VEASCPEIEVFSTVLAELNAAIGELQPLGAVVETPLAGPPADIGNRVLRCATIMLMLAGLTLASRRETVRLL
jgi:hypothetical protein